MIIRSKAPLRLGLAGGGSDVSPYSDIYGGLILNATINLYAYCTIEETSNNLITINGYDSQCFKSYGINKVSSIPCHNDMNVCLQLIILRRLLLRLPPIMTHRLVLDWVHLRLW